MQAERTYRRIMHLDMDTFFVSVERILDPSLMGKPVIVGGMPFERGVVSGCSREARVFGVHSAMPLRKAHQLCPHAVFMHGHGVYYGLYSDSVADIIEQEAPQFEKASVDEFYIDISGAARALGDERDWCRSLKQRITGELSLPLTFGVGNGKTVAKIATNVGKKSGDLHIEPGREEAFLAPLPVRMMPGIGEVTELSMKTLNITTLGQLAQLPLRVLTELFGKHGKTLQDRARGIDPTPLTLYQRQKSLGSEHTFPEDVDDRERMVTALKYLSTRIGRDLRDKGFLAKTITLKIRDHKFTTNTRAAHCDYTNADHRIFDVALHTFNALYQQGTPLRLIGITTSDLIEDYEQAALFAGRDEQLQRLYKGIDGIRDKYGKYAITYGSVLELFEDEADREKTNNAA